MRAGVHASYVVNFILGEIVESAHMEFPMGRGGRGRSRKAMASRFRWSVALSDQGAGDVRPKPMA